MRFIFLVLLCIINLFLQWQGQNPAHQKKQKVQIASDIQKLVQIQLWSCMNWFLNASIGHLQTSSDRKPAAYTMRAIEHVALTMILSFNESVLQGYLVQERRHMQSTTRTSFETTEIDSAETEHLPWRDLFLQDFSWLPGDQTNLGVLSLQLLSFASWHYQPLLHHHC